MQKSIHRFECKNAIILNAKFMIVKCMQTHLFQQRSVTIRWRVNLPVNCHSGSSEPVSGLICDKTHTRSVSKHPPCKMKLWWEEGDVRKHSCKSIYSSSGEIDHG